MHSGRRPYKLTDVFPRPALDGKRLPGDVEIHQNGVRYISMSNQRIDVLFSNVKHLFFQPCDNELVVLIHFHLKSPIMIGKKKTKDIQFFREATDMQFDETGNRKRKFRYGDEDEIEMEQSERARRSKMNKEFKAFAEKISDAASTSVCIRCFVVHWSLLDLDYRTASPLKWISHTLNWRLRVFHTEQTSDSPRPWTV